MELEDIYHLAKLSRLAITKEQALEYQSELAVILNYLDKLKEPALEDLSAPTGELFLGRVDQVEPFTEVEYLLRKESVDDQHDFLSVPPVFKK
ncbi:MAG: Asp-tRNA(Asn)/Glu-tRNA(Gln) amidotransferase subunit GatC [Patescibacteria group bacterium]